MVNSSYGILSCNYRIHLTAFMFESFEKCLKNQDTVILHLEILGLAVEI